MRTGRATIPMAALIAMTLLLCGFAAVSTLGVAPIDVPTDMLRGPLGVAAIAGTVLLATLCHLYGRLVGDAVGAWLLPAMSVWALAGAADALVLVTELEIEALRWLHWLSMVAALLLFGLALMAQGVDARPRPLRLAAATGTAVLVATALAVAITAAFGVVALQRDGAPYAMLAVGYLLLGACYVRTSFRSGGPLLGWVGMVLSFLGYDWLPSPLPPRLLELTGLLVASGGVARALSRVCGAQRTRLLLAEDLARSAEDRAQAEVARQAERAHEAGNALAAIEGATCMLHGGADRMAEPDRDQLTAAISAEIGRLRRLVTGDTGSDISGPFCMADALSSVVACERSLGAMIECDIPAELMALGSPSDTAAAVQNLLQNARRYGGCVITIRATTEEEHVVLHVWDQGAGVPTEDRDRIFERGWRGAGGGQLPGSGLGLHVARRLMERQGGELRLVPEDHRGGACFTLRLPGLTGGASVGRVADLPADELVHQPQEGGRLGRRHLRQLEPIEYDADDVASFIELDDAASGHLIG